MTIKSSIFSKLETQIPIQAGTAFTCIILLLVLLNSACIERKNNEPSKPKMVRKEQKENIPTRIKQDTILNSVGAYVNKHLFTAYCKTGYNTFVMNDKGDTVYQDSTYSSEIKFIDFNNDGYQDILIDYLTNVPGIQDLLLYDKQENTFQKIANFQDFPNSIRIRNSNYYYSYHRSGCADMNWDSDLFYIKNYTAVKIGNINGNQCHDINIKDGIYINKIHKGKEIQVQKLSINIIEKYRDYKWGFIAQYWKKNYQTFGNVGH